MAETDRPTDDVFPPGFIDCLRRLLDDGFNPDQISSLVGLMVMVGEFSDQMDGEDIVRRVWGVLKAMKEF